ncbi:MAG: GTPase Era [Thiotrichaceae bacterium]|nr:GTPase Era [Thiotrichaceae bacterium]
MTKKCGFVSIVGHPNVGKSTLLNLLVGYKISAIANKPQTTRTNIRGIITEDNYQLILTDTPGIHQRSGNALNQVLNKEAVASLEQADAVVMMVEAGRWTAEDDLVISRLKHSQCPVLLLVNKVDMIKDKTKLLAYLQKVSGQRVFDDIIPMSATKQINTDVFLKKAVSYLPMGDFIYPADYITDKPVKDICSELIREQLVIYLHQEIPYTTAVNIEKFEETEKITTIHATIWVGKKGQKGIVIGKKGATLKRIGSSGRIALEEFLDAKVMLKLWVKVEEHWQNNPRHLGELGITRTT